MNKSTDNYINFIYIKLQITHTACIVLHFDITIMEYDFETMSVSWTINSTLSVNSTLQANEPFPYDLWPLFQSKTWCSSFNMNIEFHSHANESKFSYEKLSLSLIHISEPTRRVVISYAVFCLKKKK